MATLRDVSDVFKAGDRVRGKIGRRCMFEATRDGGFASSCVGRLHLTAAQKRLAKDIAAAVFRTPVGNGDLDHRTIRKALRKIGR